MSNGAILKDPLPARTHPWRALLHTEDSWAVWIGLAFVFLPLLVVVAHGVGDADAGNPLAAWFGKPGAWSDNPREAFFDRQRSLLPAMGFVLVASLAAFGAAARFMEVSFRRFVPGFVTLFLLAGLAYLLAGQRVIKYYNLEYALWALLVGLLIGNTIGTPRFLRTAARGELYIKTGLVLLGAEVLLNRLLALGPPGIFISWVVTPVVLITTFWFGQRVLKMESPTLNIVISADMSVCGVSAAIATAAACRAKKEELSLAIGMSLFFTVVMMVAMPAAIRAIGLSQVVGGAWMGGTIDATGAVAAAGAMLGDEALQVAATVKMIQNILIGAIAFGVAVYWAARVESSPGAATVGIGEIWRRFPKFILGFVGVSLAFTVFQWLHPQGEQLVEAVIGGCTTTVRGWFFCLAFVSIGLETDIRQLLRQLGGGKPLVLYVAGQSLNLVLTLAMAWLMFEKVFVGAADVLQK